MTSPVNVGSVSVDLVVEAKAFAKQLRKEVESAFKDLDIRGQIAKSLEGKAFRIQVEPEFDTASIGEKVKRTRAPKVPVDLDPDTESIPEKVRKTRTPKVPVEVDPLLAQFQIQLRRDVASLARQVNANIPVNADTAKLRAELGAELKALSESSRLQIPTEPGAKAQYEARLRAMLEEVSARVTQTVKVKPKLDDTGGFTKIGAALGGLIPDIGNLGAGIRGIAEAVGDFASEAAAGGSQLAAGIAAAAGPVGTIVSLLVQAATAMGALSLAAVVAVPALTAVAGAAAAIPAALSGLGALFGTLGLGLRGITEAFKPKTGGGGGAGSSAANQARQIASASRQVEAARRGIVAANRALEASERSLAAAERGTVTAQRNLADAEESLAEAQQRAKASQDAVSKARKDALENIDDLNRALKGAKLSEKEAALGVEDALRALNEAKLTGQIPDIERAQLAYERAQLAVEDAADATQDLQEQTDDANKKGVEGSDQVQQALKDQADAYKAVKSAQEGVVDAQNGILDSLDALKSAQDGVASSLDGQKAAADALTSAQESLAGAQEKTAAGAAAAAAKMIPLAPAAQKFVAAIKALKPAFESLRLDVQQKLFAGLDKTVTSMWKAWDSQLHATLGSFATTINGFVKDLAGAVSTPEFVKQFAVGAEGFRQLMAQIGKAITDDLIPAFGDLSEAAGPFLSDLGKELAGILSDFSDWISKAHDSGALTSFFDRASNALHDIFGTTKLVIAIVGDLFSIITGAQPGGANESPLDSLNRGLQSVHAFLSDPSNQKSIQDTIRDIQSAIISFGQLASSIDGFFTQLRGKGDESQSVGDAIGQALVSGLLAGVGIGFKLYLKTLLNYFLPGGPLILGIKDALGIHSPSTVMMGIGQDLILGLINGIGSLLGSLGKFAGNIRVYIVNAAASAGSWLYNAGRSAVTSLINGINSMLGSLGKFAGNVRIYVTNAAVSAGSWLYNAGRAVISGLMSGIQSMLGPLGSFLGQIGGFIQNHKGPLEADRKLLVVAGQAIMGGLIAGIDSKQGELADKLSDVTSLVEATNPALAISAQTDAISSSLSVSNNRTLTLAWKTGAAAVDPILRALQDHIVVQYNGDVNAALGN